jgi:mannitol/fructose-specific phosphotransferase system IIA component (Ntr-type)
MSVLARLQPELIRVEPPWRTFPETVSGLVALLVRAGSIPEGSAAAAVGAVAARESEGSTALLDIHAGVPHARFDGVERTALALAVSANGLFEAVPTVPIQIVALVLSPLAARAEHLNVLAEMATLLRSAELRAALLAARDGGDVLAALRHHARPTP